MAVTRKRWTLRVASAVAALFATPTAGAQSARYAELWSDPTIEARITAGIEANRKDRFTIAVTDPAGRPVPDAAVEVRLVRHAFTFGANGFMVGGYPTPARNALWERRFAGLFNTTTAPFYHRDLEPVAGRPRFAADSAPIYRRPPPDAVLAFADRHRLDVKGHTLVWNHPVHQIPDYWPQEAIAAERMIERRVAAIAARYGERIPTWDVVNEALHGQRFRTAVRMPEDYVFKAFVTADRLFPASTKLLINEATSGAWREGNGEYTPYYLLIDNLIRRGARVDAIGLQFHYFSEAEFAQVLAGETDRPDDLLRTLDTYARLGRPLHVTEITVPTVAGPGGEATQATIARNLYRLWFSHPSVEAITWWNLVDGTALGREDKWNGGLLRRDTLEPKAAFAALDRLINAEWRTQASLNTDANGQAVFRGFYGRYEVKVTTPTGSTTVLRDLERGALRLQGVAVGAGRPTR